MIVKTSVMCVVLVHCVAAISHTFFDKQTKITEEERRAAEREEDRDLKQSQTSSRGLWLLGQNPQYGSAEGVGYGATGYGHTANAYQENNYYGNQGYGLARPTAYGYGLENNGYSQGYIPQGYIPQEYGYEVQQQEEQNGDMSLNKGLILKKLLLPLAGLALLGTAAALHSKPILLQLGTVSSGRKKRSVEEKSFKNNIYPVNNFVKPLK